MRCPRIGQSHHALVQWKASPQCPILILQAGPNGSPAMKESNSPMHELLAGLAFVLMILSPSLVATRCASLESNS